jgi:hypothetical protein
MAQMEIGYDWSNLHRQFLFNIVLPYSFYYMVGILFYKVPVFFSILSQIVTKNA